MSEAQKSFGHFVAHAVDPFLVGKSTEPHTRVATIPVHT